MFMFSRFASRQLVNAVVRSNVPMTASFYDSSYIGIDKFLKIRLAIERENQNKLGINLISFNVFSACINMQ